MRSRKIRFYRILSMFLAVVLAVPLCFQMAEPAFAASTASIADGYYIIRSALDNNKVVDIARASADNGARAQIYSYNGTGAQIFYLKKNVDYYYIINLNSNKALDVANGARNSGTPIWQYQQNQTGAQRWYIENAGGGYVRFRSVLGNLYLDVTGGRSQDSTPLQAYTGNGTNAQKFKLTAVTPKAYQMVAKAKVEVGSKISKYWRWYNGSNRNDNGCAIFVSYLARQTGVSTTLLPTKTTVTSGFMAYYKSKGWWKERSTSNYTPKAGDLVIFDWDKDGTGDHVGLVSSVTTSSITSIDTSEMSGSIVVERSWSRSNSNIKGYAAIPY